MPRLYLQLSVNRTGLASSDIAINHRFKQYLRFLMIDFYDSRPFISSLHDKFDFLVFRCVRITFYYIAEFFIYEIGCIQIYKIP